MDWSSTATRFPRLRLIVLGLLTLCLMAPVANAAGLDLAPYKGKVVYLDFWASWCNPCRESFPWMNGLQETLASKGFVVIAVNVDHDRALADRFLQQNPAQFKIVYDSEGAIAEQYDFKDMPTSILIGRDGKVRYVHAGFFPEKKRTYLAHINELLNEKAP